MGSYRIFQSYRDDPFGEDDLLLEWDGQKNRWVQAYRSFCSSVWLYDEGELSERANKVLLEHFGLAQWECGSSPAMVLNMRRDQLVQLASHQEEECL